MDLSITRWSILHIRGSGRTDWQDFRILKAGEEGYVTNFTICPVNIVGAGSGPIAVPSQFIKLLVSFLLQYQRPTYPGEGSSRYNYVRSRG